jgi:pyruvate,orthophosphate dikinase
MAKKLAKKKIAKKKVARKKASGAKASGRMIYYFGKSKCDGDGTMRDLLGGKGANLAQMTKIGLPVPPGFTITTQVCIDYYTNGKKFPAGLEDQIAAYVKTTEKETGQKVWGSKKRPASQRPLRCPGQHAGHDGHHS